MSFKDDKIPIESQLMLDYANGMPFKDVLHKYREYLMIYLGDNQFDDFCVCLSILEDM